MPKITVVKAFQLQGADGTKKVFGVGVHDVNADTAAHWYVKAHSEAADEPESIVEDSDEAHSEAAADQPEEQLDSNAKRQGRSSKSE